MNRAAERVALGGRVAGCAFGATMHRPDFVRSGPFGVTEAGGTVFPKPVLGL